MGQCVQLLVFFAVVTLLFDVMNAITKLVAFPGARHFFSSACPSNITVIIQKGTRVYNDTNFTLDGSFVVSRNTSNETGLTAIVENDYCSQDLVRKDVAVAGIALDVYTSLVGYLICGGRRTAPRAPTSPARRRRASCPSPGRQRRSANDTPRPSQQSLSAAGHVAR